MHFVLVNADPTDHEFVLGDEAVQAGHEDDAMSGGAMMHDAGAVSVPSSKTVELTYKFEKVGTVIYGCHVKDHYPAGMRGTITVTA